MVMMRNYSLCEVAVLVVVILYYMVFEYNFVVMMMKKIYDVLMDILVCSLM